MCKQYILPLPPPQFFSVENSPFPVRLLRIRARARENPRAQFSAPLSRRPLQEFLQFAFLFRSSSSPLSRFFFSVFIAGNFQKKALVSRPARVFPRTHVGRGGVSVRKKKSRQTSILLLNHSSFPGPSCSCSL